MLVHKRIMELLKGVEWPILFKSFIGILISLTYIIQAIFLGNIIKQLYLGHAYASIFKDTLIIGFTMIFRMALIWYNKYYGTRIMEKIKNHLRKRAYDKLLKLGPAFLTEERTGEIEGTIVSGVDYLEGYLTLYIPQILVCFLVSGAIIAYIFTVHIILGLMVLMSIILALISPRVFGQVMKKGSQDLWDAYIGLNADLVDNIQGMQTLKSYNMGESTGIKIKKQMHDLFEKTMQSLKFNLLEVGISDFSTSLGSAFTLALAALFTYLGIIHANQLILLLFLTTEVFRPTKDLASYFHQGFMGMISSDGLFSLLDERINVEDMGAQTLNHDFNTLRFHQIDFSYPGSNKKALEGIDFIVNKGENIAIVGESGSGKSTLVNLLMRFYDPDKGGIEIDERDVRAFTLRSLRDTLSVVSQDTYLFNGTIKENLYLARENISEEEMINSCKMANIHAFIMQLPDAYDSIVGERGLNFSGGERQRLSIARAILKKSPIIVLDEATSSIDKVNESVIQDSLNKLLRGKMSITIAHRLNTIEKAERIIVLKSGKIVEVGTHQSLLNNKSYYAKLIRAQNLEGYYENL